MSEIITFPLPTGPNYVIPDIGDENWGQNVTDFLVAIPLGVMPTSGVFTLTGDVSFGPTFGLVSNYFKSSTLNPASTGFLRLAKTDALEWRNNANSANLALAINGSDQLTFNGSPLTITTGNLTDVGTDGIVITGGTGAVVGSGTSIAQHVADSSHNGYLSSSDWTTFNNKQSPITTGNLTDAGTDGITVTGGTGAVIGSGTSISQHVADSTHNGYLSSTDWSTFNSAAGGGITSLTGDITGTGPGATATTLATVNSNVGSFTNINAITVNAKGLITAASSDNSPSFSQLHLASNLQQLLFQPVGSPSASLTISAPVTGTNAPIWTFPNDSLNYTFAGLENAQTFTGTKTFSNPTVFANGTILLPSIGFSGDTTTGFSYASGTIQVSSGASEVFQFTSTENRSYLPLAMQSHKITGLTNGTASTDAAAFGQIKVIQIVSATSTTAFSTTSSSFQTTNLSASITPTSSSNKVIIIASGSVESATQNNNIQVTIARGGTNILASGGQFQLDTVTGGDTTVPCTLSYLDSPASTSALTYAVQILSGDNTHTARFGGTNQTQSIILAEVVA